MNSPGKEPSPEAERRSFLDRFDSKDQKLFGTVRTAMRRRFPTANEKAYEYPGSVVVRYSPTHRGIEAVVFEATSQLSDPDVEALVAAAIAHATDPMTAEGKGTVVIQSSAAKRRPASERVPSLGPLVSWLRRRRPVSALRRCAIRWRMLALPPLSREGPGSAMTREGGTLYGGKCRCAG